MIEKEESF